MLVEITCKKEFSSFNASDSFACSHVNPDANL